MPQQHNMLVKLLSAKAGGVQMRIDQLELIRCTNAYIKPNHIMLRLPNITLNAAPEPAPRCTNTPGPSTYISLTSHRRSLPEYPNRRVSAKVYLFLQFSMQPGSINPSTSAQINNSPAAGQDLGPACAFNMDMLSFFVALTSRFTPFPPCSRSIEPLHTTFYPSLKPA